MFLKMFYLPICPGGETETIRTTAPAGRHLSCSDQVVKNRQNPMHHFLYILPLLALGLFLYLPFEQALILFVPVLVVYLILCRLAWKDRRRRTTLGVEGMIGRTAEVIGSEGGQVKVFYRGEIWDVVCSEPLSKDDKVIITGVKQMKLVVMRSDGRVAAN